MASPAKPVLPETLERRCPACQSEQVVYTGRIIGVAGVIKVEHRCAACGTAFWFVRPRLPRSIAPRGDWWTKVAPYS
jgi:uncharacterized protein (DUF983 family)